MEALSTNRSNGFNLDEKTPLRRHCRVENEARVGATSEVLGGMRASIEQFLGLGFGQGRRK